MAAVPTLSVISCRWDWCRSTFPSIDALDVHVKHEHVWPMKPMRKAEIALMRRMDLQSLHSSAHTDSSIIPRGPISDALQSQAPPLAGSPASAPQTCSHPENEEFDTFAQLSSPPRTHSPQRLPASPTLESLVRPNGPSGLSAAVEMFERMHDHMANQRLRLPPCQRSPMHHPLSDSSSSSQEVVEQQLTQEDGVGPLPLLASEPPIENEFSDTELRWPTGDELDVLATEETQDSSQPVSSQGYPPSGSLDPARGQFFRHGSLTVPLGEDLYARASAPNSFQAPHASQGSHSPSQLFVLQTQAPYSSQVAGSSQSL